MLGPALPPRHCSGHHSLKEDSQLAPQGDTRTIICEQASRHSRALETDQASVVEGALQAHPFRSCYKIEDACLGLFYIPQKF